MQWRRGSVFVLITGTNALISSALFVAEEDVVDGGDVGCGDVSVAGDVGILLIVVAVAEEDVVEGSDVVGCNYSIAIHVAMYCWLGLDDSQESAFGVVTTVYKFEVTGLWPSEVAEDDACGHILAAGGPSVNVLAARRYANHVDKCSSRPCATSEIGTTIVPNPGVGLVVVVGLEVNELLSVDPCCTRWNVGIGEVNVL